MSDHANAETSKYVNTSVLHVIIFFKGDVTTGKRLSNRNNYIITTS